MPDKTLRRKIEALKRQKITSGKVVNLHEFKALRDDQENRTILVVDDDEVMRNALKRILESEGYQVIVAEDGLELSKILETNSLDLVLLDINLPWVDGFELCGLIKSSVALKGVPLILISGRKTQEDVDRGFESGADDYIVKPFEIDHIVEVIGKRLSETV